MMMMMMMIMTIFLQNGSIHGEEKKGVLEQKNTTHIGQEQVYDKQHEILYSTKLKQPLKTYWNFTLVLFLVKHKTTKTYDTDRF